MNLGDVYWQDVKGRPAWRWATVEATSPALSLKVKGEDLPIGADSLVLAHVGPLVVGDEVWCQIQTGGAVVVIGKAG